MTIAAWRIIRPPDWAEVWRLSWFDMDGNRLVQSDEHDIGQTISIEVPQVPFLDAQGWYEFEVIDKRFLNDLTEKKKTDIWINDVSSFSEVFDWGFVSTEPPNGEPPNGEPPGGGDNPLGFLEGDFLGWEGFGGMSGKQSAVIVGGGALIGFMLLATVASK